MGKVKWNAVSGLVLMLLLTSMLTSIFIVQPVKAEPGTIYIRADGSVDPPTVPIQRDGDTYTFTDNINDSIVVEKSNMIIEGSGYTLQGTGSWANPQKGIYLFNISNATIKHTNIKGFFQGILLNSTSHNVISGNNITDNYAAIELHYSLYNSITENNISENIAPNAGLGLLLHSSSHNSVSGNNITANSNIGISLGYSSNYNSISGNKIGNNIGGIYFDNSSRNDISENNITSNGWHGIELSSSSNYNSISRNSITNSYDAGIAFYSSSNHNSMFGNNITGAGSESRSQGIVLSKSSNNTVVGNDITNNAYGIHFGGSNNSIISGNRMENNWRGVAFDLSSCQNSIAGNNITNNDFGVYFFVSSNNKFYHNNFIDNGVPVGFFYSSNTHIWDDGYPSGGNYWSDYTGVDLKNGSKQDQLGSDGIGDTPYIIDADNRDRYPLIDQFVMPTEETDVVVLVTTMGNITIELFGDMPITTGNFKSLTRFGIYDGTLFHRVISNFVIQGGDASAKGIVVPPIPDELPNKHSNVRGYVAMAKTSEPNSARDQFYINLGNNSYLDAHYSVFGRVVAGMDVVDRISEVPTDESDRPLQNVTILKAQLVTRARVGLVLATGGLGDRSFNDVTWAGVKRAEEELGVDFDYVEPTAIAEYEGFQRAFAATGDYDIIICVGFDQADALTKVAAEYPSQKFAIVDGVVDKPNVASLLFKANEGSFLVGVVAGMKTDSGKVGFVGGMDIPLIRDYFMGYEAGAKWANPVVEVVAPVFVGSWADPTKGKELAEGLIDLGTDVVYSVAGKSGLGVMQAVHERGILGLGVDACQCYLYPEVIASMTKRVDVVAFDMIKATIYEAFQGGVHNGGLKEGWVGCCRLPEEESFWEEMFGFTHAFLDTSVIDKIDQARDKIVAGEITVPPTRVRVPGVAPGQFLHYSASMAITGNDTELIPHILPMPQGWANVTVLSVSGVNVTYQTVFYNVTTKTSRTDTLNIESGLINGSSTVFPGPFLAANLSAGDPIYTALPYYLNETVTADYLGLHLETDHLILSENQTNSNAYGYILNTTQTQHCYWERKTGIWLDWFVEGNTSRPDGAGGVLVTHIQYRVLILSAIARRMIPGKDVPTETPDFFPSVLAKLNIPTSQFALQAFSIWTNYENTNAYWNPLATTWNMGEKSWNFNWAGVKNYADKETGIQATANTLALNYYESIREMLAIQSFNEQHLREAVATWSGLDPNDAYVVNLVNEWRSIYPVSVNQPPFASFTYSPKSPFYSGDLVSFDASNSGDPDGSIASYRWDFGDGMTAEGKTVSHRFRGTQNEAKTYTVTLIVEDDEGAKDTDTVYVAVGPLEKTVEVSYLPAVPVPGQQVFGKMTVTYNWIKDTDYVVSKIYYRFEGFLGFGDISIWDMHSHIVPTPRWAVAIPTTGKTEKIYFPKLDEVQYGGDTFEGISVEAFDAMNIYITGWAGISFSIGTPPLPFFRTASACFEPDSTSVPNLPIEEPDLNLALLGSPGELRVYDSQGLVTGLINREMKEEIPNSAYFNNTVMILSQGNSYRYEVAGREDGSYGLLVASFKNGNITAFTATDIPISTNAIHQYNFNWTTLAQGAKGVNLRIDSDGDGIFEKAFTSDSNLTQDEFMLQVSPIEAFPMWIIGVAIAAVAIATAAAVFWRRRKQPLIKR